MRAANYATPRLDLGVALEEYPLTFQGFVAADILPVFSTPKKEATFSAVTRESILRPVDVRRSARGAYARADSDVDDLSYRCEEFGLEGPLGDDERAFYASDFDAEMVTVGMTRDRLAREREKRVSTKIFNTTTWTGSSLYTDLSTDWDDASSTIVADVEAAKQKVRQNCGLMPNTIVIPAGAVPWLKANTDLKARLQYVQALTDQAIMMSLPQIFGIDRVIVAGAVKSTAGEGEAIAAADIWDDNYCWIGVCARTQNLAEPCVGRTMLWTADSPTEFTTEEYREEQTRSWIYRVRHHLDEKVFDPYFAHLLKIDT